MDDDDDEDDETVRKIYRCIENFQQIRLNPLLRNEIVNFPWMQKEHPDTQIELTRIAKEYTVKLAQ